MGVGRELIEYLGYARNWASVLYAMILSPQIPVRCYYPHFADEETEAQGDGAKELSGGSQDSEPHLSNTKAHVLSYFCAADIRWSVIFSNGPANSLLRTYLTPGNISEMFQQRHFALAWCHGWNSVCIWGTEEIALAVWTCLFLYFALLGG